MPEEITSDGFSPKPQIRLKTAFFVLVIFLLLLGNETYRPHASFIGTKEVEIVSGLGSRQIGSLLKQEGVIRSKWIFVVYASLKFQASNLKPGKYTFTDRDSVADAVKILARGAPNENIVVIPEGWSVKNISEYLEKQNFLRSEVFKNVTGPTGAEKFKKSFAFLQDKPASAGLEGYLFPDTYRFYKDANEEDVILKMLGNFDKKLSSDLRQEIAKQNKTIFQVVTMASLIEKEVASAEDRALISGILWKRLKYNIPLQVDATITFLKDQLEYPKNPDGKVSLADLKINSPYNTYRNKGLPLGPIGNPGLTAIRAAIYPQESPHLYYLSAPPNGKTIFSQTLEKHNEAKNEYLK